MCWRDLPGSRKGNADVAPPAFSLGELAQLDAGGIHVQAGWRQPGIEAVQEGLQGGVGVGFQPGGIGLGHQIVAIARPEPALKVAADQVLPRLVPIEVAQHHQVAAEVVHRFRTSQTDAT